MMTRFGFGSHRTVALIAGVAAVVLGGGAYGVAWATSAPASGRGTVAGSAASPGSPGSVSGSVPVVDTSSFPKGGNGIFTDRCRYAKTEADDPILMPGRTGMSMVHDFYGNENPSANSTPASLVGGSTRCSTSADSSAYWIPQLYQNGKPLTPTSTLLYWRAAKTQSSSVKTLPAGLTMIAGNEHGTEPAGTSTIAWGCASSKQSKKLADPADSDGGPGLTASPHACTDGRRLREVITFPDCWDGKTLNGSTGQNVIDAPSKNAACPASHPIRIPQLVMHFNYPTTSDADLTLSMSPTERGPITTAHADFMNGWKQSALNADVAACTAANTRCAGVAGPDATPQGSKASPQKKERRKLARQHKRAENRHTSAH